MKLAFTLDVDPDANRPVPGRPDAVSPPLEEGRARFDAVEKGFQEVLTILTACAAPATVFLESRTAGALADRGVDVAGLCRGHEVACHARRHEDLVGDSTGVRLTREEIRDLVAEAVEQIQRVTGERPRGFRAPYTAADETVFDVLAELGFDYDSSLTRPVSLDVSRPAAPAEDETRPERLAAGLWEIPLLTFRGPRGKKMSCYLWPLFEGRRGVEDYAAAVAAFARAYPNGVFQLGVHPWHLFCDERGEAFDAARAARRAREFEEVVRRAAQTEGVELAALRACIPGHPQRR